MASQIFLNEDEVLDLLMAELPDGVYADDLADNSDPSRRSVSSSELRAMARLLAEVYQNLDDINADKHLTTVTQGGLADWEKELFSGAQDSTLPFEVRKQNLISKKRATGGISLPAIRSIVAGVLDPVGLSFEVLPYSGQATGDRTGAWIFGVSLLGEGTFLSELDPLLGKRKDFVDLNCAHDYNSAGLTQAQMEAIQRTAYLYEVRIYGVANAQTLALLDMRLTEKEPARSSHIIRNGAVSDQVDPAAYAAATPEFSRFRPQG